MTRPLTPLLLLTLSLACTSNTSTPLDPDRILHMAGEEAGQVAAPRERLARQLNIANRETQTSKPAEARQTLSKARETLEKSPKDAFSDQQRLAGWISLAELARNADDKPFANAALDRATAALNDLNPQQDRCQYVLGIEREVKLLRGPADAAKLLVTAGDWAMELPDQPTRRAAFFAFSNELFRCNDYDGARTVMRKDQDAGWRSDALMALSDRARGEAEASAPSSFGWRSGKRTEGFLDPAEMVATPASPVAGSIGNPTTAESPRSFPTSFGKSLDFKSNYYRP